MRDITIVRSNFIIIRTPTVWYAVSLKYIKENVDIHPLFQKALELLKELGEDENV